jgi:hypothetical protein
MPPGASGTSTPAGYATPASVCASRNASTPCTSAPLRRPLRMRAPLQRQVVSRLSPNAVRVARWSKIVRRVTA